MLQEHPFVTSQHKLISWKILPTQEIFSVRKEILQFSGTIHVLVVWDYCSTHCVPNKNTQKPPCYSLDEKLGIQCSCLLNRSGEQVGSARFLPDGDTTGPIQSEDQFLNVQIGFTVATDSIDTNPDGVSRIA